MSPMFLKKILKWLTFFTTTRLISSEKVASCLYVKLAKVFYIPFYGKFFSLLPLQKWCFRRPELHQKQSLKET